MRYKPLTLIVLYSFFLLPGRVYGIGEKIITLGASASWELLEKKQGIIEASNIRPHSVLALSTHRNPPPGNAYDESASGLDLSLSFDEGGASRFADSRGNYDVSVFPSMAAAPLGRAGTGAAACFTSRGY